MDYLEEALGMTKFHHLDSSIPKTRFMSVLLDHGSRTHVRDSSIFNNISGEFDHKLHCFKVGHLPRRPLRKSYFKCADLGITPLRGHTIPIWWLTNR
jgi:hypothetical protein